MHRSGIVVLCLLAGCPGPAPKPVVPPDKPIVVDLPEDEPLVPPALPELEPMELSWDGAESAYVDFTYGFAIDGARAVFAGADGGVRTAPIAGGPATLLAGFESIDAFTIRDGVIYVSADGALWSIAADGTITGLARVSARVLTASDDAIYLGDSYAITKVPRGGGEPITIASEPGEVWSIAVTSTHVYWTDAGDSYEPRFGAVKRAPVGGGRVQSRAAYYPVALAVAGDHVYWSDAHDGAVVRATLDGNGVEVVLGGRGGSLAADATSTVAITEAGILAEVAPDGTAWVKSIGTFGTVALSADTIYVASYPPSSVVTRYPRGATGTTVHAAPSSRILDVAVSGSDVYYLDARADDGADRVMRVPAAGGAPVAVLEQVGELDSLAVSGEHVVTYDAATGTLLTGGKSIALEMYPDAIAADATRVYWLEQWKISAASYDTGATEVLWVPPEDQQYNVSPSPPLWLALSGRTLVASGMVFPGVVRVALDPPAKAQGKSKKKPKKPTPRGVVIAPGATAGAAAGDRTVAWTDKGLALYPGGKVLLPIADGEDEWSIRQIVADERAAFALRSGALVRVPLDGGAPETLLYLDEARLALTPDALYVAAPSLDALLRIAR